ncbi:MAG: CRTAC1 family protein [Fuerstiella sp.]|nr:CRTAC1 family protein [Fuerstiella sp.]
MKRKAFLLLWLPLMLVLGYGVGHLQYENEVWTADHDLFTSLNVRPAVLPSTTEKPASFEAADTGIRFAELQNTGVDFVYENGPDGQFHLAETLGGGVGVFDFDNDGHVDLVFADGGDPVTWPSSRKQRIQLYRHHGAVFFRPVTDTASLSWTGYAHGCSVMDIDNDGFDDLLVTGYQKSALFMNQGDGTFQENSDWQQLTGSRWCATAAASDLDGDGDVDVYITCYAETPRALPTPVCESEGQRIHCNPRTYAGMPDVLIENTGNDQFVDRTESSGIADFAEYGLGVATADLDLDGAQEIFVANDGDRNLLFRQVASWRYQEIALGRGVAYNGQGETMGAMGVACADFDRNGWLDLLTTNFAFERNVLYANLGGLAFVDVSQGSSIDAPTRASVGWSAVTLDADLDGFRDVFIANGHVTQMPSQRWAQRPHLFRGTISGLQLCSGTGNYFEQDWHARGACRVDLNEDGIDDLVISHIDTPASLLQNTTAAVGNMLNLRLIGTASCRSATGAIIEVETAAGRTVHNVGRNGGYLSTSSNIQRIGVGDVERVDVVRIRWPGGQVREVRDVPTNIRLIIIQGRSLPVISVVR